jgi:hypothetical protein
MGYGFSRISLFSPSLRVHKVLRSVADPDPDPDWIRIQIGACIRIRIQQGNFSCFDACVQKSLNSENSIKYEQGPVPVQVFK